MFRLIRSLNNNAALVKNHKGEQAVVMGLGISFQKKKGDLIPSDNIEKVFSLKNDETKENFLMLLKDVPLDFITVTFETIDDLVTIYQYPVQSYLYVTLTDHIYCSYKMLQNKTYQESKLPNLANDYPLEYSMAQEALKRFRQGLYFDFPDDEGSRLVLHFINAKGHETQNSPQTIPNGQSLFVAIEERLKEYGITRQESNSNYFDRLMIHLNYFVNDLERDEPANHSILNLEDHIQKEYPKAYDIGQAIYQILSEKTTIHPFEGEKLYLTLHIERLL